MPTMDCDAHGWNFEPGDACPVCEGIVLERERIIALLNDNTCPKCESGDLVHQGCEGNLDAVALIKELSQNANTESVSENHNLPAELQDALDRLTIRKKPE
jgi:hypothetical protein